MQSIKDIVYGNYVARIMGHSEKRGGPSVKFTVSIMNGKGFGEVMLKSRSFKTLKGAEQFAVEQIG